MKKKRRTVLSLIVAMLLPMSASANVVYTVQKGDSYWLIAKKFNTALDRLLSENNADENAYLEVGQKLNICSDTYTVQKGDSFYLIAKKCGVTLDNLLKENGATQSSILQIGDIIKIPSSDSANYHTAVKGDTYYLIAKKYSVSLSELLLENNADEKSVLLIGDKVKIPSAQTGTAPNVSVQPDTTVCENYISYKTYTVKRNDTYWSIAIDCGIPMEELLSANSLSESSYIYEGQKLTVPVHHIAVKQTPGEKYGELLDWFSEAQYVLPINADFTVIDFSTGKSFNARRTVGSGHADCETLTKEDTETLKEIWGGYFNWNKRSVLVIYNGRKLAGSAAGMMHAGNESAPGGEWTSWRSDNYGAGINYDYIKGNGADGHFDLYFYNSIGHSSGNTNAAHQSNILKAAGKE